MRFGGRLQAAIDIFSEIETRLRPASEALKDWGTAHRFAGSKDRHVIGSLVYDALRWRASSGWCMGDDGARAVLLAMVNRQWKLSVEKLAEVCGSDKFSPERLAENEKKRLMTADLSEAPDYIRADAPQWTVSEFAKTFGENWLQEVQALAARAPMDLRVNTLKAQRENIWPELVALGAEKTEISPIGLRFAACRDEARPVNIKITEGWQRGWLEVQDEASQLAALFVGAQPGDKILDYCAGAGGKALALSAEMNNQGKVYAWDSDRGRLSNLYGRMERAGAYNIDIVKSPDALEGLQGSMDAVLVDAPCSGSGVWRRRPDTKWRLREKSLAMREATQAKILEQAGTYVRQGGRLVYVTCSLFARENEAQIAKFLAGNEQFKAILAENIWRDFGGEGNKIRPRFVADGGLYFSPASTHTDGFFIALLEKKS